VVSPQGYALETQGTQHVVFQGSGDAHIHELYWDNDGWHHNDLTDETSAPVPFTLGIPAVYPFEAQFTQHVTYIGVGALTSQIYELYWDKNDGWNVNTLTNTSGTPLAEVGAITGYVFATQGTQHIVYQGNDRLSTSCGGILRVGMRTI
jgi:hypothetical protein